VFDLENIETGWARFQEGEAPDWVMDEEPGNKAPRPSPDHKRGFKVNIFCHELGAREFSSSTAGARMAIQSCMDQYDAGKAKNKGKLPTFKFEGSVAKKVGKGQTRIPTLNLCQWVKRPAELDLNDDLDLDL
jgi:hypothetical protein